MECSPVHWLSRRACPRSEARGGELTDKATAKVNVPVASPVANALARQGMKTGVGAAKSKVGIKPAPAPTK